VDSEYRAIQVMTASIVVEEHTRVCLPEPVCHRCLKSWPCGDVVWAYDILLCEDLPG
jgi:hypothetical protein